MFQIVDALNFECVQANLCQSLKVDLATLDAKKKTLREELKQQGIQKERLHDSILKIDENLANKQHDI